MRRRGGTRWVLALALLAGPATAQADPRAATQTEIDAAWKAAEASAIRGPTTIPLLDEAQLTLPAGEVFIPAAPANRIMAALGNDAGPERSGLIVGRGTKARWLVDVEWTKQGYVRDGDAKDWQPAALFDSLKAGTQESNARRVARGIPTLDLIGWIEPPTYDAATHRLVWSMAARERGAAAGSPTGVNYNTYALGRDGYFSLDLITGSDTIGADKRIARNLLGSLNFRPGKRYADFNGATDKVAEYGLAALVGVVAVKKLGLLAMAGVFLLKVWKLGAIALAAGAAGVRRFFGRRDRMDAAG